MKMNELNLKINWKITTLETPTDTIIRSITWHIGEAPFDNNLEDIIKTLTFNDFDNFHPKTRFWCSVHIKEQNKVLYGFTELSDRRSMEKYIERMKTDFVKDLLLRSWLDSKKQKEKCEMNENHEDIVIGGISLEPICNDCIREKLKEEKD